MALRDVLPRQRVVAQLAALDDDNPPVPICQRTGSQQAAETSPYDDGLLPRHNPSNMTCHECLGRQLCKTASGDREDASMSGTTQLRRRAKSPDNRAGRSPFVAGDSPKPDTFPRLLP
jgi:hypothetical protein